MPLIQNLESFLVGNGAKTMHALGAQRWENHSAACKPTVTLVENEAVTKHHHAVQTVKRSRVILVVAYEDVPNGLCVRTGHERAMKNAKANKSPVFASDLGNVSVRSGPHRRRASDQPMPA